MIVYNVQKRKAPLRVEGTITGLRWTALVKGGTRSGLAALLSKGEDVNSGRTACDHM